MASLNIASLVLHIDELRIMMVDQTLDILALNETRLDSTISDNLVHIEGYIIIRRDRNRSGGGVCIYLRSNINYRLRADLNNEPFEILSIDIFKPNSVPFNITALYRPPSCNVGFFSSLEKIVQTLDVESKEFILLGDLNCNYITENYDNQLNHLKQISETFQLTQLIKEPTRITPLSKTLIDVIFSNDPSRIILTGVAHIGISYHSLVYAVRKIAIPTKNTHKYVTTRSFKNFNAESFISDLKEVPWNILSHCNTSDEMLEIWQELFTSIADVHAPIRSRRVRNKQSPWITSQIRKMIIDRDKLKKRAIITNDINLWVSFKKMRNLVTNKVKEAKSRYYHSQIEKNVSDSRAIWKTANQLSHRKHTSNSTINELVVNEVSYTEPSALCEIFNDHFSNIGPKLAASMTDSEKSFDFYIKPTKYSFNLQPITPEFVSSILIKMPTHKSTGLDNISCRLLKAAAPVICFSLSTIINKSIESGIFPSCWKNAKVFPLFKANDRTDPNNYRPISVLPVMSKICEKAVYGQLYSYLTEHKLLAKYQSGFRSLHSTVTALLDATNEWYLNMDEGLMNLVVFLDLAKAFDTVSHNILLQKLKYYGVDGLTLSWFESYLSNRQQQCVVGNCTSKPRKLTCGVPQGSILGPLLFLIYINDLPACLQCTTPRMYADDTTLSAASKSTIDLQQKVNCDLNNVKTWLLSNKLSLNVLKTEYMFIGSEFRLSNLGRVSSLIFDNQPIKRVTTAKHLGVVLDDNLAWHEQIYHICKRVGRSINCLKQARKFVPKNILLVIYSSLILPLFDYCDAVWANLNKGLSSKLQKLQNRAARIITFQGYDIRSSDILNHLNWDQLSVRRSKRICVIMNNIINGTVPDYLSQMFMKRDEINSYRQRLRESENNLIITRIPKTEYCKKSFSCRGAKHWSSK